MNLYLEINELLNGIFLDGRYNSTHIYLSMEKEDREALARRLAIDEEHVDLQIGKIVVNTLDFTQRNIYHTHTTQFLLWQKKQDASAPPFTALLVALTLGAEHMRSGAQYSSNNYYQRLYEVLGIAGDESKKQKIRQAAKHTIPFWLALNRWLIDHDYDFGKPTARQVNNWKYASYALSQALVRQADRKRFHRMFAEFGLSPGGDLGESQIELYLHEWIREAGPTGPSMWLRRMWDSTGLRERVIAAAANELQSWDGRIDGAGDGDFPLKKLGWAAVVRGFPSVSVRFYLVTSALEDGEGLDVRLAEGSSALARKAMSDADWVWFERLPGVNMHALAPLEKLTLSALFQTTIELEEKRGVPRYRHDPRLVVPLLKDESGAFYREVSRVAMHSKHLVVCHSSLQNQVREHLGTCARQGFRHLEGDSKNGIPEGWTVFQNVEIFGEVSQDVNKDLECLVPLPAGTHIEMFGGLKIAQNIWHADAPPEVRAVDGHGLMEVRLETRDPNAEDPLVCHTRPENFDGLFIAGCGIDLDSLNLQLLALRGGKTLAEREISFRSARTPRKTRDPSSPSLAYPLAKLGPGTWGTSASLKADLAEGAPAVQGMIATGCLDTEAIERTQTDESSINVSHDGGQEDGDYDMTFIHGLENACFTRGYHVWQLPYFKTTVPTSWKEQCNECGAVQMHIKQKRKKHKIRKGQRVQLRPPSWVRLQVPDRQERSVSTDTAFDAACYLGAGTAASLESVLATTVDSPWKVSIVSSNLVDLGLIDIAMDAGFRRLGHWSCPPPALVLSTTGAAFLAGFRNEPLVRRVEECMSKVAAVYDVIAQDLAPVAHIWKIGSMEIAEVEALVTGIVDPLGREVRVVQGPALAIAWQMPRVSEIKKTLTPIHVEDKSDLERFDPKEGRWRKSRLDRAGSYRASFHGRRYFYRGGDGRSLETSFELAKLLAAREEGIRLHAYHPGNATLECVVGCQPPGILRRALVSCSGRLPELHGERLVYTHVPLEVGSLLIHKLYN